MISISLLLASDACLPDWSLWISMGMTLRSRVVIVFAYIFRSNFRSEIGRKFWGIVGSFPGLGRVMISACRDFCGNLEVVATSLNSVVKWGASCSANCL